MSSLVWKCRRNSSIYTFVVGEELNSFPSFTGNVMRDDEMQFLVMQLSNWAR